MYLRSRLSCENSVQLWEASRYLWQMTSRNPLEKHSLTDPDLGCSDESFRSSEDDLPCRCTCLWPARRRERGTHQPRFCLSLFARDLAKSRHSVAKIREMIAKCTADPSSWRLFFLDEK
ncbi:hypothetical protein HNY73_005684 [Argiope bruennichi]|uniref:Uncharacterized protein n=1 Tax=Argiope bruennichi TaxID=94029 RepID=A0A8T0FJS0_ARGBR|nr:hypothetical protein HNY73_005684 [Argiope bruennichi]